MGAQNNVQKIVCKKNSDVVCEIVNSNNMITKKIVNILLKNKDVKLNDKRIHFNMATKNGDVISYFCSENFIKQNLKNNEALLETIYEDDNLLIVNKPSGIESCGKNSCEEILNNKGANVKAVHRLDRNTMGLLMLAKNEETLDLLKKATKENKIEKFYLAWVAPKYKGEEKTYTAYLFKDAKKSLAIISNNMQKGYTKIETHIKPLKDDNDKTLLEIRIHNGKTHQIRAHLSYLGYPIIGDGKYGKNEINKKFKEKTQLLFAYKIKFRFNEDYVLSYLNEKNILAKNAKFN